MNERKDSITKKQLAEIAFTKKFFEEHFNGENAQELNSKYIDNLFQVLYVEKRRVTGLTQREKAKIAFTANYIKEQAKAAVDNYKKLQTPEAKDLAEKWTECYNHYIKYFVEKALGTDKKEDNEATM